MSLEKLKNCQHVSKIVISGKSVCQDCGLELEDIFVNPLYVNSYENPDLCMNSNNKQYVNSVGRERYVFNLGTVVGNKIENIKYNNFSRLRQRQIHVQGKGKETELYIFITLNNACNFLKLPYYIIDDAALRFKKIIHSKVYIPNKITCIMFCLWDSIRHFKHRTYLKEVIEAFKLFGHRVRQRAIVRDGSLFREVLFQAGFEKTRPKLPKDYINRNIAILRNELKFITERLEYKQYKTTPEVFLSMIENKACEILNGLEPILTQKGYNPYTCAVATIYFANIIIANNNHKGTVLTQKYLAKLTNASEYNIRDIYNNIYTKYFTNKK